MFKNHGTTMLSVLTDSSWTVYSDLLHPLLTVYETLHFTAMLRLPRSMSNGEKMDRVEIIMATLGLVACAEVMVGTGKDGPLSESQRTRVKIGVEILLKPTAILIGERPPPAEHGRLNSEYGYYLRFCHIITSPHYLCKKTNDIQVMAPERPSYPFTLLVCNCKKISLISHLSNAPILFPSLICDKIEVFVAFKFCCTSQRKYIFMLVLEAQQSSLPEISACKGTVFGLQMIPQVDWTVLPPSA